jgi:hypothetical protein
MKRLFGAAVVATLVVLAAGPARADDKDATAILDKGIKALGGEDKLSKITAATWKAKGKMTFGGNDSEMTSTATVQGLDHMRQEFDGEFNGNKVHGVTIVAGDKGWQKFGDMGGELPKDRLTNQKRAIYLQVIPITLVQLKGKDFKIETAGEEKVDGKPAAGLKVTGPDKKDFTLYFDKDSGLPVKMTAKVMGFGGQESTQETTFGGYKEMGGIKKATKLETKRNGEKFQELEITEFKVLDKVDPKQFEEPK